MAAAWQRLLGYRTCTACRWNVRWSKRCVHRAPTVQRRPSLHDRSPRMRLANCIAAEAGCQNSLNALRKIYNADDKEPGKEFISKEYLESIYRSCHEAQMEVKTEEREKVKTEEREKHSGTMFLCSEEALQQRVKGS